MKGFLFKNKLVIKIRESPKARDLFKNSLWSILGATLSKGLLFISWIIVARILDTDGYGQFGIIRSTVIMFTAFAGFGLGITASKHVAEFLDTDKEKTGKIVGLTIIFGILMGLIVGSLFYSFSPWLAQNTLNAPEITGELQIAALILFFSSLNGAQMGALEGFMAFKLIAKINVIQSLISFPLFIFGALYGGINGTIWAFALSYIIICFLSNYAINKQAKKSGVKIDYRNSLDESSILFRYSLPAFLSGLMVSPIKWYSDSLLVSRSGFSEMGLFTAALTFNNIILVGAGMLSAPFIAIMARNKDDNRNSPFSRFNILAPWALGIALASPFIMFPELGGFIFGKSYAGENFNLTFILVLLFTIVIMFKQGLGRIMMVYDLQWWSFMSNLFWGIILLTTFLLFSKQNAYFLAFSYLIAYVLNTIVILPVYFKRKIIPLQTIESIEAFSIWGLLIMMSFSGFYIQSILIKLPLLLAFLMLFFILFKKSFLKRINV